MILKLEARKRFSGEIVPAAQSIKVESVEEASVKVRKWIEMFNLGSSNIKKTCIYKNNKLVAVIAYNGRVIEE